MKLQQALIYWESMLGNFGNFAILMQYRYGEIIVMKLQEDSKMWYVAM